MNYSAPYYNGYFGVPYSSGGAMPDMLSQMKGQQLQQGVQPSQFPQSQQMPGVPAQPVNDMLWVLGEVDAMSYPVAPNNTVTLWDKNHPTIYIKSVNAQGVPSLRILDFTERLPNAPKNSTEHECKCGGKYVSKEDFKALEAKYTELAARLDGMTAKPLTEDVK